ncbi:MAG: C25 family cysteine peptidase [Candidatus Bilamarchaeum sp.]|jgi:hypothetical protein
MRSAILILVAFLLFGCLSHNTEAPNTNSPNLSHVQSPTPYLENKTITCPTSCDDMNLCTSDTCSDSTNFQCIHSDIIPCLGNGICEMSESCTNSSDCQCNSDSTNQFANDTKFVIITRPIFLSKTIKYANWKSQNGIKTKVVTADEISHNYPGRYVTDKIKNYIRSENQHSGAKYFMLVGDAEFDLDYATYDNFDDLALQMSNLNDSWSIPVACDVSSYWPTIYNRSITVDNCIDFFYADSRDWDPDQDGIYQDTHIRSNVSVVSAFNFTVYVSRIPVRDPSELDNIFDKYRNYQRATKVYFSEGDDAYNPLFYNYSRPDEIFRSYPCDGIVGLPKYLSYTRISVEAELVPSQEQNRNVLISKLFDEHTVSIEQFHGTLSCFYPPGMEPICGYDNLERSPLLLTGSCYIDAFYSKAGDSMFERLLKNESGPAILVSNPMAVSLVAYLANGSTIGEAYYRSLSQANIETGGGTRAFLGDPTLVVFENPGFDPNFNLSNSPITTFGCYPIR